jgi:hypothetical protein
MAGYTSRRLVVVARIFVCVISRSCCLFVRVPARISEERAGFFRRHSAQLLAITAVFSFVKLCCIYVCVVMRLLRSRRRESPPPSFRRF